MTLRRWRFASCRQQGRSWLGFLAVIALVLIGFVVAWIGVDGDDRPKNAISINPTSHWQTDAPGSKPDALSPALTVREAVPSQVHGTSASLLAMLHKSRSLRVFVDTSLRKPEEGGIAYALAAVGACFDEAAGATHVPKDLLKKAAGQDVAAALLIARCDLDIAERERMMRVIFEKQSVRLKDDPITGEAMRVAAAGRSRESRMSLASILLDRADPVGMYTLTGLGPDESALYFHGEQYSSPNDQRRVDDAWMAVRCQFGYPCGSDAIETLRLCRDRGWCADSTPQALRLGYAPDSAGLAQHLRLVGAMETAIRNRDVAAFVEPVVKPAGSKP
jgi:hypothetical protein